MTVTRRASRFLLATTMVLTGLVALQVGTAGRAFAPPTPTTDCGVFGNLVANCGFETGDLTAWVSSGATVDGSDVHSGTDAANLSGPGTAAISQVVAGTEDGKQYDLTVWITTTTLRDSISVTVSNVLGGTQAFSIPAQPFDDPIPYEVIAVPFIATASPPIFTITDVNSGSGGSYHVDDVAVAPASCSDVPGNLVQNCGFETGDTTDWTPTLSGPFAGVAAVAHSGSEAFAFANTDFDTLTQTLAGTHDGDEYEVAFWLRGSASGSAEFSASVLNAQGGSSILVATAGPPGPGDYQRFTGTFTAGSSAPTLQFAGRNPPAAFYLDDISVRQTASTVTFDSQGGSAVAPQSVDVGDPAIQPTDPTRSGYTFEGWNPTPGGTANYWSFSDPVGSTLTLYALWSPTDPVCDVPGNLVQNCSFEDGTTNWTAPSAPSTGIDADPIFLPHSGDHFYGFGASGTDSTLSQVIAGTTPGTRYHLSFWVRNDAPNPHLTARVTGTSGGGEVDVPAIPQTLAPYTEYHVGFQAGPSSPTVEFTGRNAGGAYSLDDVLVTLSPPSPPGSSGGPGATPTPTPTATPSSTASPTASPTPTSTSGVTDPTITVHVVSAHKKHHGWYRSPVHISFTCTPGSSSLASPCPDPVTLSKSKKGQKVTASVDGTDGGDDSVTVTVNIDRVGPTIHVKRNSHGKLRCRATDALSGMASCKIVHRDLGLRHGKPVVRWTAKATDVAGNVTTKHGHTP